MGRVSIDTQQCEIKKIFSDEFVFTIPRYQRPYAWTTEEAGMLLEDLLNAMGDSNQDVEETPPYFLGSIVLTKGEKPDSEVIDGQQRLTTITILLAALRALIHVESARDLDHFLYEKANAFAGTPSRYRLTLRKRDAEFFQQYIQSENGIKNLSTLPKMGLSESQRNIRDNSLAFMQRLQHLSEKERVRLGKFLVTNCFVVVVSTADFDTAYRIFSVLNDRGRNLTYADILKAQIIGDIPAEKEEEYANKWEEIEVLLGSENFQQLLTLIRILSSETRIRKNLLEEFHTYVYPNGQLKMTAQQLIDRLLQPYGYTLHTIITADYKDSQYAPEIEELLRWLNRLPAALQYWGRNRDNPDLLLRFLQDLDRLSVGLLLLNTSYNRRSERYYQLQTAIKQSKNVYASDSPLQLSDDEQRDIYRALNGNLYININASLCKYILLRLDALLSKQKNHDANNYDFAKKKAVYFSNRQGISPFALTSQVICEPDWTPAVIQKRQQELVSKLADYWNLKSPTVPKSPSLRVVRGA